MINKKKILIVGASSLVGNDLFLNLRKIFHITGTYYTYRNNFNKKNNFYQINLKSRKPFKKLKNNIFHTQPCGFYIKNTPFPTEMAS